MDFNKIKIILIVLFVLMAGILYSCSNSKNSGIIDLDKTDTSKTDGNLPGSNLIDSNLIGGDKSPNHDNPVQGDTSKEPFNEGQNLIYIHICGAVNKPDVYEVEEGTRLYELVKVAGGLTSDAAGDYINQASIVEDGQQVYIPTNEELEDSNFTSPIASLIEEANGKVNINKASKEELMTLSGIGESKANTIIEYRQKYGDFKRIEDIMNINGIKGAAFNKISEFITVN